jgi:carotenoid cleavage dioxygenase
VHTTEICDVTADGGFRRTVTHQHDLEKGTAVAHDFADGEMPGECIVLPRPGSSAEGDAWAAIFVHGRNGEGTELVILDVSRFASPPVARIRIPGRVPLGLHAEWFADLS